MVTFCPHRKSLARRRNIPKTVLNLFRQADEDIGPYENAGSIHAGGHTGPPLRRRILDGGASAPHSFSRSKNRSMRIPLFFSTSLRSRQTRRSTVSMAFRAACSRPVPASSSPTRTAENTSPVPGKWTWMKSKGRVKYRPCR